MSDNRLYIADWAGTERVEGVFTISNAQIGRTRQDKPYLRCLIRDRTGEVAGRMWSVDEAILRKLPTDGFVFVEGETQPYQGEMQLIINRIEPHEPTDQELIELLPTSARQPNEMFSEVEAILGTLEHPAMQALATTYLTDEHLMDAFRTAPAAKSMHHAYLGGLLEHTLQLLKIADAIMPLYPMLNRDIVLMGLFLHDLGKTRELSYDGPFNYTDRGELVGHIVEGAIMLHDKAQQMMLATGQRLPANALLVLQHIILSHHTLPEYGAAKVPSTPEAIFVAQLDNLDAKTFIAIDASGRTKKKSVDLKGNFTQKQWALDTKIFRPDPLG